MACVSVLVGGKTWHWSLELVQQELGALLLLGMVGWHNYILWIEKALDFICIVRAFQIIVVDALKNIAPFMQNLQFHDSRAIQAGWVLEDTVEVVARTG